MVDLLISFFILLTALYVLVRGADLFVSGAKQVGMAMGMSKFAIGVIIVGFGTPLPELAASVAASINGVPEIIIANVVGSNITNILLIVGIVAAIGGRIIIERELIKTELPIFFAATALFILAVYDGSIDRIESFLLFGTFVTYLWYLLIEAKSEDDINLTKQGRRPYPELRSVVFIILGVAAVVFGAKYAVDMVVEIALTLSVPITLVSISAIAVGTSLPELFVAIRAMQLGEPELAVGNIFGSSIFNLLVVVGLPGIFVAPLIADSVVMGLGLPILIVASAIFFVSGMAKQIMRWQGMMMVLFFGFFAFKLVTFCIACLTAP
jgi:cation:H+ antiporter